MKLVKLMNNFHVIYNDINGTVTYFSYETCIAFIKDDLLTIRQNDWRQTTGKHLNFIDENKEIRITGAEFEQKLRASFN